MCVCVCASRGVTAVDRSTAECCERFREREKEMEKEKDCSSLLRLSSSSSHSIQNLVFSAAAEERQCDSYLIAAVIALEQTENSGKRQKQRPDHSLSLSFFLCLSFYTIIRQKQRCSEKSA